MPVHTLPTNTPDTDAALFDELQTMFGYGSHDESLMPWWRWRIAEISKIKASRKKRQASVAELYVAALYCRAYGINIMAATWLYSFIGRAWAWWDRSSDGPLTNSAFEQTYAEAIRLEMDIEDSYWLGRLLRADGDVRGEVYDEWLAGHA